MVQLGCCCILNLGSHIVCQRMIASQTTYKATVQDGTVRLLLYLQPWFTYSPLENESYQLARPHIKQRCRMVQLGCCCILYLGSHIVCLRMIASQTTYKATVQDGTVRLLLHPLPWFTYSLLGNQLDHMFICMQSFDIKSTYESPSPLYNNLLYTS